MAASPVQSVTTSGMIALVDNEPVGDMIKRRRRAIDATQTQLAERARCAISTLGDLENNRREQFDVLPRVLAALEQMEPEHAAGVLATGTPRPAEALNLPSGLM